MVTRTALRKQMHDFTIAAHDLLNMLVAIAPKKPDNAPTEFSDLCMLYSSDISRVYATLRRVRESAIYAALPTDESEPKV